MTNNLNNNALILYYMKNIYNRLKAIRQDKNLSQEEMADLLNKTQSSYARIERGATKLDVETLFDFAKALNLRPIDIITYPEIYVKKNSNIVNDSKGEYKLHNDDDRENELSLNIKISSKKTKQEILKMVFGQNLSEI